MKYQHEKRIPNTRVLDELLRKKKRVNRRRMRHEFAVYAPTYAFSYEHSCLHLNRSRNLDFPLNMLIGSKNENINSLYRLTRAIYFSMNDVRCHETCIYTYASNLSARFDNINKTKYKRVKERERGRGSSIFF